MQHWHLAVLSLYLLTAEATAQAPNAMSLLSDDWRIRNATAQALAKAPAIERQALLQVLRTDWHGEVLHQGVLWNSRLGGRSGSRDPRDTTITSARTEIGYHWRPAMEPWPESTRQIVGPWHPHVLAAWILGERQVPIEITELQPSTEILARVWLLCGQPDAQQLQAALADDATATPVAISMWLQAQQSPSLLQQWIASGPPAARRAALRLADHNLPLNQKQLDGVVQQFLFDQDDAYRRNAGYHLVARGAPAAAALAPHLGAGRDERLRILAALCMMNEHAEHCASQLLGCLEHDTISQRRALVALSNIAIPPALQATAAQQLLDHAQATHSVIVRALAIDALGNCREGINKEQLARLQEMLQESSYSGVRARLLGCLRQLGAADGIPLKDKIRMAEAIHPTTQTWLAVCDAGAEAAASPEATEAIAAALQNYRISVARSQLCDRLAETATKLLRQWLDHDNESLRQLAFAALQRNHPDQIETSHLLAILARQDSLMAPAFDLLCSRPAAADHFELLVTTAARPEFNLNEQRIARMRELSPAFADLLKVFATRLQHGQCWDVIRGIDDTTLRKHCRDWLTAANEPTLRDHLVAELIQLGISEHGRRHRCKIPRCFADANANGTCQRRTAANRSSRRSQQPPIAESSVGLLAAQHKRWRKIAHHQPADRCLSKRLAQQATQPQSRTRRVRLQVTERAELAARRQHLVHLLDNLVHGRQQNQRQTR